MTVRIQLILLVIFTLITANDLYALKKKKVRLFLDTTEIESTVKLTIITPVKKRKKVVLQLERNDGAGYNRITEVSHPKRKEIIFDSQVIEGDHSYRVRLKRAKKKTIFSKEQNVSIFSTDIIPPEVAASPVPTSIPPIVNDCANIEPPAGAIYCPQGFIETVVTIVNYERTLAGLQQLSINPLLNCASDLHTAAMISSGRMSHDGWYEEIQRSGFNGRSAGQNVAWGYRTPQEVMSGWLNSPGHRANILSGKYISIGVSCMSQNGIMWWTQDFGG